MLKSITLTIDDSGNIVLAGPFTGTISVAGQQIVSASLSDDIFIAKFEAGSGQLLWTDCLDRAVIPDSSDSETSASGRELNLDVAELRSPSCPAADAEPDDRRDSCAPVALSSRETEQQCSTSRRTTGIALGVLGAMTAGVVGLMLFHRPQPTQRWAYKAPVVAQASTNATLATAREASAETTMLYQADDLLIPEPNRAPPKPADDRAVRPAVVKAQPPDVSQLAAETLRLLNQRQFDEAVTRATALVEATPTDAHAYLCLGAALQELGRIEEARTIYRACSRYAEKGAVWECVALGGRQRTAKSHG